jgi:hypothetical protein
VRIVNYKDKPTYSIWLQFDNMSQGENTYIIGQANGMHFSDGPDNPYAIVRICDEINPCKVYYSSENSGTIEITRFDYDNGIYSGIFGCTLYNIDNPEEIIEVTDGRFDIKIATLNNE